MNKRTLIVMGLALLFGISAAVAVSQMGGARSSSAEIEMAPIIVAAVDMPRGVAVTAQMLKTSTWPKAQLPAGAVAAVEQVIGRTVNIPLLAGEPVLDQKIAKSGVGRGAASLVPNGRRAFTVQTPTLTSGVAGLVLPGNKVDVLWTAQTTNAADDTAGATVTLLQNIEVLAADQQMSTTDDKTSKELRSVTLHVSETEAKKLSLAKQHGTLNLSLRNSGDSDNIDSPVVTLKDIRYAQGTPPEAVPEPTVARQPVRVRIRTLHGRQVGEVQLELHGRAAIPEPPPVVPEPTLEAGAGTERRSNSG